jgi:hypothetical protein
MKFAKRLAALDDTFSQQIAVENPKLFISHSSKDKAFAIYLAHLLIESEAQVWIDVKEIKPPQNWSDSVDTGLKECDALILIVTPDALSSRHVKDEWQYFHQHEKPIFPIVLKNPPSDRWHFQLERLQQIQFVGNDYSVAYNQLCRALADYGLHIKLHKAQ